MSDIQKRLDEVDKLKKQLASTEKSIGKDIMKELKKLMTDNPSLEAIRWEQYTPNFNDGDVCEFGTHGPYFKFDGSILPRDPESEDEDKWIMGGEYGGIDKDFFTKKSDILNYKTITALKKAVEEVESLFEKLSYLSALKDMFGDGRQVTVTRSGVETEEYDHD
jgi:hypothetical protein